MKQCIYSYAIRAKVSSWIQEEEVVFQNMTQYLDVLQMSSTKKNIDSVHHMVMNDRRLTINKITNAIRISCESVKHIIHNELAMKRISAWWVLCLLVFDQKPFKLITSRVCRKLFLDEPAGFLFFQTHL